MSLYKSNILIFPTCPLLFLSFLSFSVYKNKAWSWTRVFIFFSPFPSEIWINSGETSWDINTTQRRDLLLFRLPSLLLLMELDDLDLAGSWPLDQITFTSNLKSPVIFSSSEQPFSPLWSFSEAAGDVSGELYSAAAVAPTRFTDYSVLLTSKSRFKFRF